MRDFVKCLRLRVACLCLLGLCGAVVANNRDVNNPNAPNYQSAIANKNTTADQTFYYTHDGLGSVRTLTDKTGKIINQHDYTAFGDNHNSASIKLANEKLLTAQLVNTQSPMTKSPNEKISFHNRYTYTAREQSIFAEHNAPMYYRWRMYTPQLGRFEKRDPLGYLSGENMYCYVNANPVIYIDTYGTVWWEWIPIISTIGHFVQDCKGKNFDDYSSVKIEKCCKVGSNGWQNFNMALNKDCIKKITALENNYIKCAVGGDGIKGDIIETVGSVTLATVAKRYAVKRGSIKLLWIAASGTALTLDGLVDAAIAMRDYLNINTAARAAKLAICNCPE